MTIRPHYLFVLLIGLALLGSAIAMGRLRSASAASDAAIARLNAARADAEELLALRAQAERIATGHRAPEDVHARLRERLRASGLSTNLIRAYAEEADREISGTGPEYRRQSIRFTLSPIELNELGRFLDHWRQAEPLWIPVNIELNRSTPARGGRNARGSYEANVTIAATYVNSTATRTTP